MVDFIQSLEVKEAIFDSKKLKQAGLSWAKLSKAWTLVWRWSKLAIIGLRIDPKAFIGPTQIGKPLFFWLLCCPMANLNLSGWVGAGWS